MKKRKISPLDRTMEILLILAVLGILSFHGKQQLIVVLVHLQKNLFRPEPGIVHMGQSHDPGIGRSNFLRGTT